MSNESVTRSSDERALDLKGLGYIASIVSVLLIGVVAWPMTGEPAWHIWALCLGMAMSIVGMGLRYKAHLDERRKLRRVEKKAEQ
jgi:hypothetical protein